MNKNMKHSLIAAVVATASMAAAPAVAASGQYLGAQLAISDVGGGFDNGITFVGTFGMPLPQVNPNVAFEAELTKALVKPEYSFWGDNLEVDYYTLGGYGVYNIPSGQQINFRLRAGLAYEHITVDFPNIFGPGTSSVSDSEIGLSIGAGITVKMSPSMNFIAEYTNIDSDIDHLSAGVQMKF